MRFIPRITFSLLVLGWLGGTPLGASENRVDAIGGLQSILEDETDDLSLFLDGNPAGLSFLNTRTRLDLALQWAYSNQQGPWGTGLQHHLTTRPRETDPGLSYEGLMVFTDSHWAFQVAGDLLDDHGLPLLLAGGGADTGSLGLYRGLVRVSYAFSSWALGMEIGTQQTDQEFAPGYYNPSVSLTSGSSNQNQIGVKAGLACNLSTPTSEDSPRWQAGGYFGTQLGPTTQNQVLNVFYPSTAALQVTQTFTTPVSLNAGAELLYEVPEKAKFHLAIAFTNEDHDFGQSTNSASPYFSPAPQTPLGSSQTFDLVGGGRLTFPFTEEENLKAGGDIHFFLNNSNRPQMETIFGIGLDNPKEYTFGLQWKSLNFLSGKQAPVGGSPQSDYDVYQLAFGGERWLAPTWAFRLGLVLENDAYLGGTPNPLVTTINLGLGLEEFFGRVDFRIWLGQITDMNNSSNTVGVIGSQLSATIFL